MERKRRNVLQPFVPKGVKLKGSRLMNTFDKRGENGPKAIIQAVKLHTNSSNHNVEHLVRSDSKRLEPIQG